MNSGRRPSQTVISLEGLEEIGNKLTRLCDEIERHGLVDYEYGVWEEQIVKSMLVLAHLRVLLTPTI